MSAAKRKRPATTSTQGRSSTSSSSLFVHNPTYSLRVFKTDFKFNAAHFVAYQGFREKLHGHNYTVGVELFSKPGTSLNADGYVIDFGSIKTVVRQLCKSIHEHFLAPMQSDVITISNSKDGNNLQLNCQDGAFFSFPKDDCIELPIAHTTVEELAKYFCDCITQKLELLLIERNIERIEVTVTEAPGQSGCYSCSSAPME